MALKDILTEWLYVLCALVCFYTVYGTLRDTKNTHWNKWTTALFWGLLGVTFAFSRVGALWGDKNILIPNNIIGYLILVLTVLAAINSIKVGKVDESTPEFKQTASKKIGNIIFIPALGLGVFTFIVAQIWTVELGSLVALGIAALLSTVIGMWITKGTPKQLMDDGRRLLELVGPLSILPQLLAALGAVFTAAGVGKVIADGISTVIPQGNPLVGVIVYCLAMALFTFIMGNAFAAFAVITIGIGIPFVIAQGGNPVVVSALGLTAGYCGTLITPMAANFNIVPASILDIKDKKWGVILYQLPISALMLVIHIIAMYFLAFNR
jgi:uncharacterized membrane protein